MSYPHTIPPQRKKGNLFLCISSYQRGKFEDTSFGSIGRIKSYAYPSGRQDRKGCVGHLQPLYWEIGSGVKEEVGSRHS
jgi:hypothetical protein